MVRDLHLAAGCRRRHGRRRGRHSRGLALDRSGSRLLGVRHVLVRRATAEEGNREQQGNQLIVLLPEPGNEAERNGLANLRVHEETQQPRGERNHSNECGDSGEFDISSELHLYYQRQIFCHVKVMALVCTPLTDAHGSEFKQATPMVPKQNVQSVVESMENSLPLDTNPATRSFTPPPPPPNPVAVQTGMGTQPDKISRILSLVEQNKTGYETSSSKDMFLYVLTGVMFLFTFDTFVTLGRGMRG